MQRSKLCTGKFSKELTLKQSASDYAAREPDCRPEAGAALSLEPAIITPHGRLCREEDVVITDSGCRFLSIPQKEVWLVR